MYILKAAHPRDIVHSKIVSIEERIQQLKEILKDVTHQKSLIPVFESGNPNQITSTTEKVVKKVVSLTRTSTTEPQREITDIDVIEHLMALISKQHQYLFKNQSFDIHETRKICDLKIILDHNLTISYKMIFTKHETEDERIIRINKERALFEKTYITKEHIEIRRKFNQLNSSISALYKSKETLERNYFKLCQPEYDKQRKEVIKSLTAHQREILGLTEE